MTMELMQSHKRQKTFTVIKWAMTLK